MREFDELIEILEHLLGPDGCPWDQVQTLQSLRSTILEEVYEVIEAINLNDNPHIKEELGDLFLNIVMLSKIAEKEERFSLKSILKELNEKLIRRHPHVFGEGKKINTVDELHEQWDKIKKDEKGKEKRQSALDGISKQLPALVRAQKALKKMKKAGYSWDFSAKNASIQGEEELGGHLLGIAEMAQEKGLDAEHALLKALTHLESEFLKYEKNRS